jgi:hypothetical protein
MKIGVTAIEAFGVGVGIGFFKTSTPITTPTPMDSGSGYFLTRFRSVDMPGSAAAVENWREMRAKCSIQSADSSLEQAEEMMHGTSGFLAG